MNEFLVFTPYYLLTMFMVSSIATGMIVRKNKTKENTFIFIAFILFTFAIFMNTFYGPSVVIDVENNTTITKAGLLPINATLVLELLATLLLSAGFTGKAYSVTKQS